MPSRRRAHPRDRPDTLAPTAFTFASAALATPATGRAVRRLGESKVMQLPARSSVCRSHTIRLYI